MKSIYSAPFILALGMTAITMSFAKAEKSELKIACSHFPPSKIENSADGKRGHDIDLLFAAFKNTDFKLKIQFMPWKRAAERVKLGQSDALCACSYQPERENWLHFSDQLGLQEVGYFYNHRAQGGAIQDPEQLLDKPIGVVRSYNLHKELVDAKRKVVPVVNSERGLEMLIERRISSFFSFRNTSLYILSRLPNGNDVKYHPLRKSPYYMCFSKASPLAIEAREQFNTGLREIRHSGEYDRIFENYR